MNRSIRLVALLVVAAASVLLALTAGVSSSRASTSCGIVMAAGHPWIIVAKSVPCAKAKSVTSSFAARTNALHTGQRRTVRSPLLPGFVCVLASQGKPGGSCSVAGATKSILWLRGN
jgi:hypothetical protein